MLGEFTLHSIWHV